jgi:uncharacterized glyoxalase superfamily protein PhnB
VIENRSVPADGLLAHVFYEDVAAAIAWLSKTFGFVEHYRYGVSAEGTVSGAQMHLGSAWVMLLGMREGRSTPAKIGCGTQILTVFVEDVEGHFERAKAEGATIVEEPRETGYGELQYAALDLDGHHWLFSKHVRDVAPEEWGAVVSPDFKGL